MSFENKAYRVGYSFGIPIGTAIVQVIPRVIDAMNDPTLNYLSPTEHVYAGLWRLALTLGIDVLLTTPPAYILLSAYSSITSRRNGGNQNQMPDLEIEPLEYRT